MVLFVLVIFDVLLFLDEINLIIEWDGGVIVVKFLFWDVIEKVMSDGKDVLYFVYKFIEFIKVWFSWWIFCLL